MNHMRLEHGVLNSVLMENVLDAELATVRVTAVLEVHLTDLVWICLNKTGLARIAKCGNRAVLVAEVGKGQNNSVILALVGCKPLCVLPPLLAGLHGSVAGHILWRDDVIVSRIGNRLFHLLASTRNKTFGEEASVSEIKCNCLLFHCKSSLYKCYFTLAF